MYHRQIRQLFFTGTPQPMSEEVITQVRAPVLTEELQTELPEVIVLDLRGTVFEISRDLLLMLPENILFGLSMSAPAPQVNEDGTVQDSQAEFDGAMQIDFSPRCFQYIIDSISLKNKDLTPIPVSEFKAGSAPNQTFAISDEMEEIDEDGFDNLPWLPQDSSKVPTVLLERPSMVVLREDLEYYVFNQTEVDNDELNCMKNEVGTRIAEGFKNRYVFEGLKNSEVLDSPEYHLMQMLVLSGVDPEQVWTFRERSKNSSRILSLQMSEVNAKPEMDTLEAVYALQKLLLFWRKPAKKCWWDKFSLELNGKPIVVHARRVWTLELTILGMSG